MSNVRSTDRLAAKLSVEWPAITAARQSTEEAIARIREACEPIAVPPEVSFVVFGSLAREEWTDKSDVDWTLLIDGPADPEHFQLVPELTRALKQADLKEPGKTATFGAMVSSHDLIHYIGGQEDTNQNMTRRILLLLESVGILNEGVHSHVIEKVLQRYIALDPAVSTSNSPRSRVPLFLLNDIVRLWRTFAVDYATKKWQRGDEGWALRNIKLRMSRKLLFVKGLLMCFLCRLEFSENEFTGTDDVDNRMIEFCKERCSETPLDVLCDEFDKRECDETARQVIGAYDGFLASLADSMIRSHLDNLGFEDASADTVFEELRKGSNKFGDGLQKFFFEEDEGLSDLTKRFGVF